jgi:hypothetical protein
MSDEKKNQVPDNPTHLSEQDLDKVVGGTDKAPTTIPWGGNSPEAPKEEVTFE